MAFENGVKKCWREDWWVKPHRFCTGIAVSIRGTIDIAEIVMSV